LASIVYMHFALEAGGVHDRDAPIAAMFNTLSTGTIKKKKWASSNFIKLHQTDREGHIRCVHMSCTFAVNDFVYLRSV